MEERNAGADGPGGRNDYMWWAATAVQLNWGIYYVRKGCDGRLMPLKAFGVATLFVSALATAIVGTLNASGIRSGKDALETGAKLRARVQWLVMSPSARDKLIKKECAGPLPPARVQWLVMSPSARDELIKKECAGPLPGEEQ